MSSCVTSLSSQNSKSDSTLKNYSCSCLGLGEHGHSWCATEPTVFDKNNQTSPPFISINSNSVDSEAVKRRPLGLPPLCSTILLTSIVYDMTVRKCSTRYKTYVRCCTLPVISAYCIRNEIFELCRLRHLPSLNIGFDCLAIRKKKLRCNQIFGSRLYS